MLKKAFLFSAGNYQDSKSYPEPSISLSGVIYDIKAIEKRFKQIGFDIYIKEDARKVEICETLNKIVQNSLPSDAINVVYFTGHGGHSRGVNYIYPTDFGVIYDNNHDVDEAGINIETIISAFKGKGRLILILDACRSNFNKVSHAFFSEMTSRENVYIAYATMFQDPAIGSDDGMSLFTEAICDEILSPNITIDTLFTHIRQNLFRKYNRQLPISVNGLLENICLSTITDFDDSDKRVYDFVERYGDEYCDKYGYFHGDDLIFIDAAQYCNVSLLDAIWKFRKVDNKIYRDRGVKTSVLTEDEEKLVAFLGFTRSPKFFSYDMSHTWYYNGRQIRMGEIPPLPPSMQRKLPIMGKELNIDIKAEKLNSTIIIKTNIPNGCEIFINDNVKKFPNKYKVTDGAIEIKDAKEITKIVIDSGIFSEDEKLKELLGEKNQNIMGQLVEYHPIYGNQVKCSFVF